MSPKSDEVPRVKLEAVMATDIGVVRDHNEDAAHVDPGGAFFIVADGMGGHAAGEVASAMAVDMVRQTLDAARAQIDAFAIEPTEKGRRDLVGVLQGSVLAAHQAVFQRGQSEPDKQGMGTTLDVVLIAGSEAFIAHVGDSRTYLVRDASASQITTDHTVAEVLVIEGKLSIEEAQVSPLRTILVNAIGVSADVGVEMAHLQLKRDDRLLLCSDGLHDYFLAEEEIAERIISSNGLQLEPALKDMVEVAKERGGHDNITGIAVRIVELADGVPGAIERDQTQPVDVGIPPPVASWTDDERTENAHPVVDLDTATTLPPAVRLPQLARDARRGEASRADTMPPAVATARDDRPKQDDKPKDRADAKKDDTKKDATKKDARKKGKKPRARGGRSSKPPSTKKKTAADGAPADSAATRARSPIEGK